MAIELKKLDLEDLDIDSKAFANENDQYGRLEHVRYVLSRLSRGEMHRISQ